MKITRQQLRGIISEEIKRSLNEQGVDMPPAWEASLYRGEGEWSEEQRDSFYKKQAELGRAFVNNPAYDFVSIFDVTGVMSWPSLAEAIVKLPKPPSRKDLAILAICIAAIIPLIGKGTNLIKGYNLWSDISRGVSKTKGIPKLVRKGGNLIDDFVESSPSAKVAVEDILKRSGDDLSPAIRKKLIEAAKLIDDTQVIQWLHKKAFIMSNISDEIILRVLRLGDA